MIKYKKYKNTNEKSACFGKWYGRAVHEMMEFDEFVEHMAKHHCVYSEGTIRGVLIEMEVCLREMLLEGKAVRFDDLGIFRLGLETVGEEDPTKFTAADIKGIRMNLYLGKRFRAAQLFKDAKFKELEKYVGDGIDFDPEPDGENAVTDDQESTQGGTQGQGGSQNSGSTGAGSSSGTGSNTGGSTGGNTSGNSGSQSGTEGDYRMVIYKYGSGTSTVTDDNGQVINNNDNVHSGSNVNISVVPANGKEPIAEVNGNRITLTENDGTYTASFQMPTKGTVLEINTEPNEWDYADEN